jgi:uncharacterized membrane protein YidH (DUF202 family)
MKKNNRLRIKFFYLSFVLAFPFLTFSQATLRTFAGNIVNLLNASTALIIAIAVLVFVVGIVRFVIMSDDEKGRSEGKQMMVWGSIAIFVMVAVWGLVDIIRTTFFE